MSDESSEHADPRALQILTTEHFALQGARSVATGESSARSALYLTVLSATVVALSFSAQASKDLLMVFALLALPVVFVLGVFTYMRVLENGLEDFLYVRGINRIRHYYTEMSPEVAPYFVLSTNDDGAGAIASMGLQHSRWQRFFTVATMVLSVNSVVGGVLVGSLIRAFGDPPIGFVVGAGGIAAVGLLVGFYAHQARRWDRAFDALPARFPSTPDAR